MLVLLAQIDETAKWLGIGTAIGAVIAAIFAGVIKLMNTKLAADQARNAPIIEQFKHLLDASNSRILILEKRVDDSAAREDECRKQLIALHQRMEAYEQVAKGKGP